MRSNCVLWACALHARREARGREGYLVIRWTRLQAWPRWLRWLSRVRWLRFPHVLYGERRRNGLVRVVSYKPLQPRPKACPPPLFRGASKWGDL